MPSGIFVSWPGQEIMYFTSRTPGKTDAHKLKRACKLHTQKHTQRYRHMYTHKQTCANTHTQIGILKDAASQTDSCKQGHTQRCRHTRTQRHIQRDTGGHAHTRTHAQREICARTYMHPKGDVYTQGLPKGDLHTQGCVYAKAGGCINTAIQGGHVHTGTQTHTQRGTHTKRDVHTHTHKGGHPEGPTHIHTHRGIQSFSVSWVRK